MKFRDKAGLKFIKVSIRGLSKQKLLGVLAFCIETKTDDDKTNAKEIMTYVKDEWEFRKYDYKELESYLKILGVEEWEKEKLQQ